MNPVNAFPLEVIRRTVIKEMQNDRYQGAGESRHTQKVESVGQGISYEGSPI